MVSPRIEKKATRAEPEYCETHQTARRPMPMHHIRQEKLPFVGSSFEFVGAEQADTGVSVFLYQGKPGSGPGPHRHPYDEIQFIREGRGIWTVNGKTFEGGAGDIFVIKAGEIHSFKVTGDSPLIQLDVHVSPRFIQENL
jgi:quercetin dioxygenase-like cupin family protein